MSGTKLRVLLPAISSIYGKVGASFPLDARRLVAAFEHYLSLEENVTRRKRRAANA